MHQQFHDEEADRVVALACPMALSLLAIGLLVGVLEDEACIQHGNVTLQSRKNTDAPSKRTVSCLR